MYNYMSECTRLYEILYNYKTKSSYKYIGNYNFYSYLNMSN